MSLNLMEKRLLSLYRELYGREYDVNDTRTYENLKEYLKSNELQTTYLLFQRANVLYPNYHFMKGQHGVYSTRVQTTIDHLNQSEQDIQNFYQTYESVKNGDYFNYYCQLLSTLYPYFPDYQIYINYSYRISVSRYCKSSKRYGTIRQDSVSDARYFLPRRFDRTTRFFSTEP